MNNETNPPIPPIEPVANMNPVEPTNTPVQQLAASTTSSATTAEFAPSQPSFSLQQGLKSPYAWIVGLLALCIYQWLTSQSQINNLREEMARRLQSSDLVQSEIKGVSKSVLETTKELQAKMSIIEAKQTESIGQQMAIEQLYLDLSKNRDEWALAEIEQVLATASQQLQLAGNVQGALIALQNADTRLAKSEKAQFISVRRAIAKDIEMLKTLPQLDTAGLVLRLDSVITQVDGIPLWSDEKAPASITAPKAPLRVVDADKKIDKLNATSSSSTSESTWTSKAQDYWQSFSNDMWMEMKQLITVKKVETADAMFISPNQAYFVKENLKLRLLNARLALLSRNENAFRSDMSTAQDLLSKYFDGRSKQAQTAQSILKQVQSSNLTIEMPALTESLNAVRNFKVKP